MKKEYLCPKTKMLTPSLQRLMQITSPWPVDDEVVGEQGAKGGSFFGFDNNEDATKKSHYNVWDD